MEGPVSPKFGQSQPPLSKASKPLIKKLNPNEAYLVDDHGRPTQRICGTQLSSEPAGHLCLKPSGTGTNHPGYGPCGFHDRQLTNLKNTDLWADMNRSAGMPVNLMEYLQNAELIEEKHLSAVDTDIKLLHAIQLYVMNRHRSDPEVDPKQTRGRKNL